jgi:hypothetical protein
MKGTSAVIASYWQVDSLGTSVLMENLAGLIASGQEYGDALSGATRKLIQQRKWSHPSIWAAFTIVGTYSPSSHLNRVMNETYFENTSSVSQVTTKNTAYVQVWEDTKNFTQQLLKVDYGDPKGPLKIKVEETSVGSSIRISTNIEKGIFIAHQFKDHIDFFEKLGGENRKRLCQLKIGNEWNLTDFYVADGYLFSLVTKKSSETKFEYAVISQSKLGCETVLKGPNIFVGYKNYSSEVRIFPSHLPNSIILVFQSPVVGGRFESVNLKLNLPVTCSTLSSNEYFILDAKLNTIFNEAYSNLKFLESPNANKEGVKVILDDGCTAFHSIMQILPEALMERDVFRNEYVNHTKKSSNSDTEMINKDFSFIINWWSDQNEDKIYVHGAPLFVTYLYEDRFNKSIKNTTTKALYQHEVGLYVFSRKTKSWQKFQSTENCSSPIPLSYSNVMFSCGDFSSDKMRFDTRFFKSIH